MVSDDKWRVWLNGLKEWFRTTITRISHLYKPSTIREKGWLWAGGLFLVTFLVIAVIAGILASREPGSFDVHQNAVERGGSETPVVGASYTSTLIRVGEEILGIGDSGRVLGYLSNDVSIPGVWLDNMPNWEFGALVMLRDATGALRNHFSRSQSQSVEDEDLAIAEPKFNFDNDSWILPATESEYRTGLEALERYRLRLSDPQQPQAQFFARADNLNQFLSIVEKRLGSYSQRLSASVGQVRVNTDLAGDTHAAQSTASGGTLEVQTPWLELDDVFYEARGAAWALLHILRAVEQDFDAILRKKNALISLRQIIRELDETQQPKLSPVILNGGGFGLFANYSLTMANYIARANAAVIDLRHLLQRG